MTLADVFRGRRVLVTGSTGFKGSWLALWLELLGAKVHGLGLPPETKPSHSALLPPIKKLSIVDIRDATATARCVRETDPEVVFHLAAQPLVRRSYRQPLETWATNVMGTAHVLEACRTLQGLRAVVVITSDKCYENLGVPWGYRETDPLGGNDPYSASKGASELVAASYRKSFFSSPGAALLATARAGNVVGGGDWSEDRLVPDIVRAAVAGRPVPIRFPQATRPWQHVLDCLHGYLILCRHLLEGREDCAEAWNFGPYPESNRTVAEVLECLRRNGLDFQWSADSAQAPAEAQLLYLESAKARRRLGWRPLWNFDRSMRETVRWYVGWREGKVLSRRQIEEFMAEAYPSD